MNDDAVPSRSVDASNNASGLILRGDNLLALSDDPDELLADLQALAGPSAGPNGGSIFIRRIQRRLCGSPIPER